MSKFKLFPNQVSNIWFVDKVYGNDTTGDGSRENPYKSASAPALNGAVNGDIVVLGSGNYDDVMPITPTLNYYGEGTVIFSNPLETVNSFFRDGSASLIKNITFYNTPANVVSTDTSQVFEDCKFSYCGIRINDNRGELFKGCEFDNVIFSPGGAPRASYLNNVFNATSGFRLRTTAGVKFINNYIFNNQSNDAFSSAPQASKPTGFEFDYNCFEIGGTFLSYSLADYQGDNPVDYMNKNSIEENDPFNDFLSSRGVSEYWKQDSTLKSSSACADAGAGISFERYIGSKNIGYGFTATQIFGALAVNVNLQLDPSNGIERIDSLVDGEGETTALAIDGGNVQNVSFLLLQQLITFSLDGSVSSAVDFETDPVSDTLQNQKTVLDIQFSVGETAVQANSAPFKSYEQNFDFAVDGAGNATANPIYDATTPNPIQSVGYVRIKFRIRNF